MTPLVPLILALLVFLLSFLVFCLVVIVGGLRRNIYKQEAFVRAIGAELSAKNNLIRKQDETLDLMRKSLSQLREGLNSEL